MIQFGKPPLAVHSSPDVFIKTFQERSEEKWHLTLVKVKGHVGHVIFQLEWDQHRVRAKGIFTKEGGTHRVFGTRCLPDFSGNMHKVHHQ